LQDAYVERPGLDSAALLGAADMWLAQSGQLLRRAQMSEALRALERAKVLTERAVTALPASRHPNPPAAAPSSEPTSAAPPRGASDRPRLAAVSQLATVQGRLGQLLGNSAIGANLGRPHEAEAHLRRSLELMQSLVQQEPGNAEWLHQAAWAQQNLIGVLIVLGRPEEALPLATQMVAMRDEAARRQPENAHFRHQRGSVRATLALVLGQLGRHAEAAPLQLEALAIARATAAADAANRSAARDVTLMGLANGRLRAMAGDTAAARAALQATLAALPPAAELAGQGDFYIARMRAEAALWLARALRADEPARALQLAEEVQALMSGSDDNAARRWTLAQGLGEQAAAAAQLGDAERARGLARRALAEWAAAPGGRAPGQFRSWQMRDERLAAPA
jgi:tetratricopeptide (TPR) repeat protein